MDAMGGILTKGLGAPACCGLILAQFNLAKCCQYTVVVQDGGGGNGGSLPLAPGQIHNFYTPIGKPSPLKPLEYMVPYNPPAPVDKIVITLTMKDQEPISKEYYSPRYRSKVLLNISQIAISSVGIISVSVMNIRNRLKNRIRLVIDKFRTL